MASSTILPSSISLILIHLFIVSASSSFESSRVEIPSLDDAQRRCSARCVHAEHVSRLPFVALGTAVELGGRGVNVCSTRAKMRTPRVKWAVAECGDRLSTEPRTFVAPHTEQFMQYAHRAPYVERLVDAACLFTISCKAYGACSKSFTRCGMYWCCKAS